MDRERIFYLLDRHADGNWTAEEKQELEGYLLDSPEAQAWFWEHARLFTLLRETCQRDAGREMVEVDVQVEKAGGAVGFSADQSAEHQPLKSPTTSSLGFIGEIVSADGSMFNLPKSFASIIAAMLVGSGLTLWLERGNNQNPNDAAGLAQLNAEAESRHQPSAPAATLVSVTNCRWDRTLTTADFRPGGALRAGESLRLIEGVAEISAISSDGSEMRIQLEGPLSMVLTNNGMPSLFYGKLAGEFRGRDQFMIDTPLGRAVVMGDAGFGVTASGSEVELHVFAGQAAFDSARPLHGESTASRWSVSAGGSIHLTHRAGGEAIVKRGQADEQLFVTSASIAARQLLISDEYVAEVRRTKPVAYWRFEDVVDGVVRNEVADRLHCRVMGDGIRLHPYDGNRSAEFSPAVEPGYLLSDDLLEGIDGNSYTLEGWFKPSCYHHGALFSFIERVPLAPTDYSRRIHLELKGPIVDSLEIGGRHGPPARVRFLHLVASCYSQEPYRLLEWQHVAAVKDGPKMRLYLGGALAAEGEDNSNLNEGLRVLIGQLCPSHQETSGPGRYFLGELDEIAFHGRALNAREIETRVALAEAASGL